MKVVNAVPCVLLGHFMPVSSKTVHSLIVPDLDLKNPQIGVMWRNAASH